MSWRDMWNFLVTLVLGLGGQGEREVTIITITIKQERNDRNGWKQNKGWIIATGERFPRPKAQDPGIV